MLLLFAALAAVAVIALMLRAALHRDRAAALHEVETFSSPLVPEVDAIDTSFDRALEDAATEERDPLQDGVTHLGGAWFDAPLKRTGTDG